MDSPNLWLPEREALMHVDEKDLQILLVCSFRYALGRRTYMPSLVSEIIQEHVGALSKSDKIQILEDIRKAKATKTAGDSCDVETWSNLEKFLQGACDETADHAAR